MEKHRLGKGEWKNWCGKQRRWEQQHKRPPELLFSLTPGIGNKKIPKDGRDTMRSSYKKTLASNERMGRSEQTGVGAKCGGGQQKGA